MIACRALVAVPQAGQRGRCRRITPEEDREVVGGKVPEQAPAEDVVKNPRAANLQHAVVDAFFSHKASRQSQPITYLPRQIRRFEK